MTEVHELTAAENRRRIDKLRAEEGAPGDGRARRRSRGTGARSKNLGEGNGEAKLNAAIVREIRSSCESNAALGERFGVSKSLIGKVRRGELWGHVG